MRKSVLSLAVLLRLLLIVPVVGTVLWYDENFTLMVLRRPFVDMLQSTAGDVHPPLYYLLLWPLAQIPSLPAWWIRVPSLTFGIASLFVFDRILKKTINSDRVHLAALIVYAINSSISYYVTEGRMYTLLGLLVLLGVLSLVERRWVWLGVIGVGLMWVHNYGMFYVVCLLLAGILRDWKDWKALTLTLGLAGVTFVPWIMVLYSQMQTIQNVYWMVRLTPASVIYMFYAAFMVTGEITLDIWLLAVFYGWLTFAMVWIPVESKCNKGWKQRLFTMPWILKLVLVFSFLPLGLSILGSILWQPIVLYRALTPCVPFIGLLLVIPLSSLPASPTRRDRFGFMLALVLLVMPFVLNISRLYQSESVSHGADDQLALEALYYIQDQWRDGDIILHIGDGTLVDMLPYARAPASHYRIFDCGPVRGSLSPRTRQGLGVQILALDQVPDTRIWMISEESPMTPTCGAAMIARLVGDEQPLYCFRDDPLKRNCVYLLERTK